MTVSFFSFHESDIDAAQAAVGQSYFMASMDLLEPGTPYEFRFDGVSLGALNVGEAWYNAGIRVGMADLDSCYYVNFPQTGTMHAEHRGSSVEVVPGRGAVYQPVGDIRMHTSDDYGSYAVRINRHTLENELEARLGRPVRRPLRLDPRLDLDRGTGRGWAGLVRLLAKEAKAHGDLLTHPIITAPLHDAVVSGLLLTARHPYSDLLQRPAGSWGPAPVKRAIDAMDAHPEHPFTPAILAELAGTSVRSLHDNFRRHVGLSPLQYLQQLRLQRAHQDLLRGDPSFVRVTQTAYRWGFAHLSRFAVAYRARYGESPSQTLRRAMRD